MPLSHTQNNKSAPRSWLPRRSKSHTVPHRTSRLHKCELSFSPALLPQCTPNKLASQSEASLVPALAQLQAAPCCNSAVSCGLPASGTCIRRRQLFLCRIARCSRGMQQSSQGVGCSRAGEGKQSKTREQTWCNKKASVSRRRRDCKYKHIQVCKLGTGGCSRGRRAGTGGMHGAGQLLLLLLEACQGVGWVLETCWQCCWLCDSAAAAAHACTAISTNRGVLTTGSRAEAR